MRKDLEKAKAVVHTLQEANHIAYFAGGYVRDYLMGYPSNDIDIATSARVEEVQALFSKTIPIGVAFGIVIVVFEGKHFEVATFRKDRSYVDGRRPSGIDPATAQEDATRRDFTINGMFFDPMTNQIYDYVGGKEDIDKRIVRAIGNPNERLFEDRLRIMRAVRYSTRFGFLIEKATLHAIETHARDFLPAVAIERVWQEFKKMSQFDHFDKGLILLHKLGLLPTIFADLKEVSTKEIKQRVHFIRKFPKGSPTFAQLLELFPKIDLEKIEALSEFLKLSNAEKAFAKFYYHATALLNMPHDWLEKLEKIEWAHFYADPYANIGLEMVAVKEQDPQAFLREQDARRQPLMPHILRIQNRDPYLRGHHLIEAGIKPGKKMGNLLEKGMRIAVNGGVTDPKQLIEILKKTSIW